MLSLTCLINTFITQVQHLLDWWLHISFYLPGRAWQALCCNPASQQTLSQSLTCHNPTNKNNTVIETREHIHHMYFKFSCCTLCVSYLGSYQTYVLSHVWLHHFSHQLGLAWCTDEGTATVGWTQLLGSCCNLKFKTRQSWKSNQQLHHSKKNMYSSK